LDTATAELKNEGLNEAVGYYYDILHSQTAVLSTMAKCGKPADVQFMMAIVKEKKNKMIAIERKHRPFVTHFRTLQDSVNVFAWFAIPDEEPDTYINQLADFYSAVDFNGGKLNNPEDKKWFRAFRSVQQDFFNFIKSQYPAILKWQGTGGDAKAVYESYLGGKVDEPVKKVEAVVEKKAPAKAPLKVEKIPAVPKAPVKVLRYKTWEVSNYKDETIEFDADKIDSGFTFNFFNCENIKVAIPKKIKNFMLNKCKRVEIEVEQCVSMGEIIKCERIKLTVGTAVP